MTRETNHVVPSKSNGGWAVKKSGEEKVSKGFTRKEDAVKYAKEMSRRE